MSILEIILLAVAVAGNFFLGTAVGIIIGAKYFEEF